MEQTAVEWLALRYHHRQGYLSQEDIEQAKQMERQQIVDSFYEGMQANTFDQNKGRALMYYNETYTK